MSTHGGSRDFLSSDERERALTLLFKGLAPKTVAFELGRSPNAVHRIKRTVRLALGLSPTVITRKKVG